MAIYHLSVKSVSRATGRSSVAASAYRSGERITNDHSGLTHDYRARGDIEASMLIVPPDAAWATDRASLWNAAELAENRRDAKVAREYEVALPAELDRRGRRELVEAFSRALRDRYAVAVDASIHAPHDYGDHRNYHAHVMTTTRTATGAGLGAKTRVLDVPASAGAEVEAIRQIWETLANHALAEAGSAARIDRRALQQGTATIHLGPAAAALERRGISSERGDINRAAMATRDRIQVLEAEIFDLEVERDRRATAAAAEVERQRVAAAAAAVAAEAEGEVERQRFTAAEAEARGPAAMLAAERQRRATAAAEVERQRRVSAAEPARAEPSSLAADRTPQASQPAVAAPSPAQPTAAAPRPAAQRTVAPAVKTQNWPQLAELARRIRVMHDPARSPVSQRPLAPTVKTQDWAGRMGELARRIGVMHHRLAGQRRGWLKTRAVLPLTIVLPLPVDERPPVSPIRDALLATADGARAGLTHTTKSLAAAAAAVFAWAAEPQRRAAAKVAAVKEARDATARWEAGELKAADEAWLAGAEAREAKEWAASLELYKAMAGLTDPATTMAQAMAQIDRNEAAAKARQAEDWLHGRSPATRAAEARNKKRLPSSLAQSVADLNREAAVRRDRDRGGRGRD